MEEEKVEENKNPTPPAEEIAKDAPLITEAKAEYGKLDVLVCGTCTHVFHLVEHFQEHKAEKCLFKTRSEDELELKPQVWAFTLWKTKQIQNLEEDEVNPTAWEYYRRWCALEQSIKEPWLRAGESLEERAKFASAEVVKDEPDPLGNDAETSRRKQTILNNSLALNNVNRNTNRAFRNAKDEEVQEYAVEQIVDKRYHPKRKTFEYRIKWENFDESANTWEATANLAGCQDMLAAFEAELKQRKLDKAKLTPKGRGRGRGRPPFKPSFLADVTPGDRPQRVCKQKALSQVKAWCGNISDTDESGVKRSYEDDDSDDSFEKKMKYDDYSDEESDTNDDIRTNLSLRRVAKPTILNNGLGKNFPQNVLIPDANGVVRINQKQLPSLSTGVYIMSKTAGIIKLDSSTSKVATSGGQTIVKVAPKIGQTQIKIVKKDGGTTSKIIKMTPKGSPARTYKQIITKKKPEEGETPEAKQAEPLSATPQAQRRAGDESDDGVEDLEFPDVLAEAPPDSPPSDFVLDPFTGKIVGQDYPEKLEISDTKIEMNDSLTDSATSLENIVKIAAADITEEDLKVEPMITSPIIEPTPEIKPELDTSLEITPVSVSPAPVAVTTEAPVVITTTTTTTPIIKSPAASLLNRALTKSQMISNHRQMLANRPKVPQKVINQSVATKTTYMSPLMRGNASNHSSIVRTRPVAPRPKFNISTPSPNKFQHESPQRVAYSKQTPRRVGYTTIYKSISNSGTSLVKPQLQTRVVQSGANVHRITTPKKDPVYTTQVVQQQPQKKKTVISMPSLIGDDEAMQVDTEAVATTSEEAVATTSTATTTAATTTPSATAPASQTANLTDAELSSFTLADNENPIFVTGDDGTIYQVAGQNEQGQTILITQGSDGQQQCLLVTNEISQEETPAATSPAEPEAAESKPVEEPLSVKTDDAASASDSVVAQVVRADPLSPGGTHKVVVMLPDGNLMVTQVTPEEYANLELE